MPTCPSSPLVLEASAVVAFAGTAKLIAASTNPGAAIRGVLLRLIRQCSQSGISWGKAIGLKIGIRGDVRNWCRERALPPKADIAEPD
jgi:hypothetical protein